MIKTKFYLDKRAVEEGHAAPLKISITKNRATAYISTSIRILPADWDAAALKAKSPAVQLIADLKKADVDSLLIDLQRQRRLDGLNARQIKDLIVSELSPSDSSPLRFLQVFRDFASTRPKPRTREIYMATVSRISAFDRKAETLAFTDIDVGWLDRFDSFMARTSKKKNARNIHLRNIRAVFNYARRHGYTQCYPFMNFEIRAEPTKKRCLSAVQLRKLFFSEIPTWQRKYVDFFELSFLLIGMNTEDMLHAKGPAEGRLEYQRAKTYRPYSIKIEPECQELIDRYKGKGRLLDILDTYACTHNWTAKVNQVLKRVAGELGLPTDISMYWARHSWATIAAELDIPKETISASMGHSAGTVTDIYINFDRNKIDLANRKVMDYVLHEKKPMTVYDLLNLNLEEIRKRLAGA